jgi:hypothetical protein
MKRWLLIAAAAILTLTAITSFNTPAMAREYHPPYAHVPPPDHRVEWQRNHVRHGASVRAVPAHADHFRPPRHVLHHR